MSVRAQTAKIPSFTPARAELLQRKCARRGSQNLGVECEERRKKGSVLQRRAANQTELGTVQPIAHEMLRSPGQQLDAAARKFMESGFGHNFSQVRLHTDPTAAESARTAGTLAYTTGADFVFGTGQYSPQTGLGLRLLAHELAHVIQQGGKARDSSKAELGYFDDVLEQEAEAVGRRVAQGAKATVRERTNTPIIQGRAPEPPAGSAPVPPSTAPSLLRKPGIADLFITVTTPAEMTGSRLLSMKPSLAPNSGLTFQLARPGKFQQDEHVAAILRWKPAGSKRAAAQQNESHATFTHSFSDEAVRRTDLPGSPILTSKGDEHIYGLAVTPGLHCEEYAKKSQPPFDRNADDWTYTEVGKFIDTVTFSDREIKKVYFYEFRCVKEGSRIEGNVEYDNVDKVQRS